MENSYERDNLNKILMVMEKKLGVLKDHKAGDQMEYIELSNGIKFYKEEFETEKNFEEFKETYNSTIKYIDKDVLNDFCRYIEKKYGELTPYNLFNEIQLSLKTFMTLIDEGDFSKDPEVKAELEELEEIKRLEEKLDDLKKKEEEKLKELRSKYKDKIFLKRIK